MFINEYRQKQAFLQSCRKEQQSTYFLQVQQLTIWQRRDGKKKFVRILNKQSNLLQESNFIQVKDLINKNIKINTANPQIYLYISCKPNFSEQIYLIAFGFATLSESNTNMMIINTHKKIIGEMTYKIKKVLNALIQIRNIFAEDQLQLQQSTSAHKQKIKDNQADHAKQKQLHYSNQKMLQLSDKYMHNDFQNKKWQTIGEKLILTEKLINQSIKQSEEQRLIFNKYLDKSTQFVQQLLNQMNEKQVIKKREHFENINEDNGEVNSQTKIENKKYLIRNKKYLKHLHFSNKYKKFKKMSPDMLAKIQKTINIIQLQNYETQQTTCCRQMYSIEIDSNLKIKQIKIEVKELNSNTQTEVIKLRLKEEQQILNIWPIKFRLPQHGPLYISCISTSNTQLRGLANQIEERKGYCNLYDQIGNEKGIFYFRCKLISTSSVQTQHCTDQIKQKQQKESQHQINPQYQPCQDYLKQQKLCVYLQNENQITQKKYKQPNQINNNINQPNSLADNHQILKIKEMSSQQQSEVTKVEMLQTNKNQNEKNENNKGNNFACGFKLSLPFPLTISEQNKSKNNQQQHQSELSNERVKKQYEIDSSITSNLQKSVNMKISQIIVKLPNEFMKKQKLLMKIQINKNRNPYFTEIITANQLYCWRDKAYYFLQTNQWSFLTLKLMQTTKDFHNVVGISKIYIISLMKNQQIGINSYKTYLYNAKQIPIGQFTITYQFFKRNLILLRTMSSRLSPQNQEYQHPTKQQIKIDYNKNKQLANKKKQLKQLFTPYQSNNQFQISKNNSNLSTEKNKPLQFQSHNSLIKQSHMQPPQMQKQITRSIINTSEKRFKSAENKLFYDRLRKVSKRKNKK